MGPETEMANTWESISWTLLLLCAGTFHFPRNTRFPVFRSQAHDVQSLTALDCRLSFFQTDFLKFKSCIHTWVVLTLRLVHGKIKTIIKIWSIKIRSDVLKSRWVRGGSNLFCNMTLSSTHVVGYGHTHPGDMRPTGSRTYLNGYVGNSEMLTCKKFS